MRRCTRVRLLPAVLLILALVLPATSVAAAPTGNGQQLQTVIVGLELGNHIPERVAAELARRLGGQTGYVYSHAFLGFSMELPERMIPALERDPRIAFVEADQMVQALDVPTGVRRALRLTSTISNRPQAPVNRSRRMLMSRLSIPASPIILT